MQSSLKCFFFMHSGLLFRAHIMSYLSAQRRHIASEQVFVCICVCLRERERERPSVLERESRAELWCPRVVEVENIFTAKTEIY
uniref:Uncharacterized protein n=1 Tax=Neolamprologus brichardi TaxID=32507 RepID=A0A3Q4HMG7_NEOBR